MIDEQQRTTFTGFVIAGAPQKAGPTTGERAAKLTLIGVFSLGLLYFGRKQQRPMSWFDWLTLAFAVIRLGRMTAFEHVAEPVRAAVAQEEKHPHSGFTTEPKYSAGPLHSLGQLITCPICSGTWWAAALSAALTVPALRGPAMMMIRIQAAIGLGELIDAAIEFLCWGAAASRKQTGD